MSVILQPFTCNGCGKQRSKDTNRWWLVWRADAQYGVTFCVIAWDEAVAKMDHIYHACGQACAQKLFERWLTSESLEE